MQSATNNAHQYATRYGAALVWIFFQALASAASMVPRPDRDVLAAGVGGGITYYVTSEDLPPEVAEVWIAAREYLVGLVSADADGEEVVG